MAAKFKTTGFSRFILFLLIAAPLIYSGVAIFKCQNPMESAKRDLGISSNVQTESESSASSWSDKSELADLKSEIRELQKENKALLSKLENCK